MFLSLLTSDVEKVHEGVSRSQEYNHHHIHHRRRRRRRRHHHHHHHHHHHVILKENEINVVFTPHQGDFSLQHTSYHYRNGCRSRKPQPIKRQSCGAKCW
ncbi:nuclear fragile X mental retardation-interacting protein 2-like isoform X2 [Mastomys coucha]|nr:nuclear fragile X mental retardation-interacting protein 2-like isoform X2 [Mastomys coucha]